MSTTSIVDIQYKNKLDSKRIRKFRMPEVQSKVRKTNVTPGIGIIRYLQHIEYKAWYAIAEYIDNSIESYHRNINDLPGGLEVHIEISDSGKTLTIFDNSAGISDADIERAIIPATPPPIGSKLSEFGMGMKTASYWFSNTWKLETTAIGEDTRKVCEFDIETLRNEGTGEVEWHEFEEKKSSHWTKITLTNLNHKLSNPKRVNKIRSHLANTYKALLSDKIKIRFNGELLEYQDPEIMVEPFWPKADRASISAGSPAIRWHKEFEFEVNGKIVVGNAFLTKAGSTKTTGMTLYRRGRAIAGTSEEKEQPDIIYGAKHGRRRLFLCIEVHMDDFKVPTTKSGVIYEGDDEEIFHEQLIQVLREGNDFIKQADNFCSNDPASGKSKKAVEEIVAGSVDALSEPITRAVQNEPGDNKSQSSVIKNYPPSDIRDITLTDRSGDEWTIKWSISKDPSPEKVFDVQQCAPKERLVNVIIYVNSAFIETHVRFDDENFYRPPLLLIAAMAAGETLSKVLGENDVELVREWTNFLLNQNLDIQDA